MLKIAVVHFFHVGDYYDSNRVWNPCGRQLITAAVRSCTASLVPFFAQLFFWAFLTKHRAVLKWAYHEAF